MKRVLLFLTIFIIISSAVFSQVTSTFSLSGTPLVNIPLGPQEESSGGNLYTVGAGLSVRAGLNMPFFRALSTSALINLDFLPYGEKSLTVLGFGPEIGFTLNPAPRLNIRLAGYGGLYLGMVEAGTVRNPFFGGGLDVNYLLNPGMSLTVGAGYKRYMLPPYDFASDPLYEGVAINLGASWHVGAGDGSRIEYSPYIQPIFPLFYSYYDRNSLGELVLTNSEADAITDVSVSFYVPQYMDQPKPSGVSIESMGRGQSETVPIYALFTDDILDVTEGDTAAAEILVNYRYLGRTQQLSIPISVDINNRNALTWDDDRKVAALVTAKDPSVLGFAKGIAGTIRAEETSAVNDTFRIALGLFEALNIYGISYIPDPTTPYIELSENPTAVDYCQFPSQTFAYRAGDCDDLSILYAALLESVGIEAAFVTAPGHIYLAFKLGMAPEEAAEIFENTSELIFRDGETWVPVEITLVRDGFLRAWQVAAREWRETSDNGTAGFFPVREAWEVYEPVGFGQQAMIQVPDNRVVMDRYFEVMDRFVTRQIQNRVDDLRRQIASSRNNLRYINRLGVLYARFGRLDEAADQFEQVVGQREYGPALVNLGHIAYLQGDFDLAVQYYNRAIPASADSSKALVGLAKAEYERENYRVVDDALAQLQDSDPAAAEEIAYLGTGFTGDGNRASAALERNVTGSAWDEEEGLE
jgi:hypothetical protein